MKKVSRKMKVAETWIGDGYDFYFLNGEYAGYTLKSRLGLKNMKLKTGDTVNLTIEKVKA